MLYVIGIINFQNCMTDTRTMFLVLVWGLLSIFFNAASSIFFSDVNETFVDMKIIYSINKMYETFFY